MYSLKLSRQPAEWNASRSTFEATPIIYLGRAGGRRYSPMGGTLRSDLNQGDERATYNPLYVLHERNLGWSSLREQKDHGTAVVLVEVTLDQEGWESQS